MPNGRILTILMFFVIAPLIFTGIYILAVESIDYKTFVTGIITAAIGACYAVGIESFRRDRRV